MDAARGAERDPEEKAGCSPRPSPSPGGAAAGPRTAPSPSGAAIPHPPRCAAIQTLDCAGSSRPLRACFSCTPEPGGFL